MNLYTYCGNGPVGRVDPFGLAWTGDWRTDPTAVFEVRIAFYDGGDDPDSFWRLDGSDYEQCANDKNFFDFHIDLRLGEKWGYTGEAGSFGDLTVFLTMMLERPENWAGAENSGYHEYWREHWEDPDVWEKVKITDVYIFDHGTQDTLDIGDITLPSKSDELSAFLTGVGAALGTTGPDAKLHFRGCQIGNTDSFVQYLADKSGHTVTAVWGDITMRWLFGEFPGRDYNFQHGLRQATPGGTPTIVWKNCTEIGVDQFGNPYCYNPWGPQPY